MEVREHRLYQDDEPMAYRQSPNQSGEITPEFIVMHFTKGASAESSVNWLCNPAARASAHLVIGKQGEITQLVEFNRRAWHAGRSQWDGRSGLNGFSVGIELDNFGDLNGTSGKWRTSWGREVPDNNVTTLSHKFDNRDRGWNVYPEKQLLAALEVCQALVKQYRIRGIVGHDDIAPGRKFDPGPAFPMESFRAALFGRENDNEALFETVTALNIRTGPGTQYEKLALSPLPERTPLEIIGQSGIWREVSTMAPVNGEMDVVGWVHSRYIRALDKLPVA